MMISAKKRKGGIVMIPLNDILMGQSEMMKYKLSMATSYFNKRNLGESKSFYPDEKDEKKKTHHLGSFYQSR